MAPRSEAPRPVGTAVPALTAAAPAPRRSLSGLGLIGFGLVLALLAVALVQARQFQLVQTALRAGNDQAVLSVYQAQLEYLRLREAWQRAAAAPTAASADELRLRYDIWVSRIDLLEVDRAQRLLRAVPDRDDTLTSLHRFVLQADEALGPAPRRPLDAAFLSERLPALVALDAPLQALSLAAGHQLAQQLDERRLAVQQQSRLGLGLTVFMSVLTLAFAAIALRQVRQLRLRRAALEQLAASLGQARREAEAASQAKSAFLANISHEIRTPFHGLMGMLSLLRETGLNARQIDYLRTATESADHLLVILNDVLDMSRLEHGRLTLLPTPVDVRALLRDVEALMRPPALAKRLALHIEVDPAVPERVMADGTRVKQILFNLLSNAIKFSDSGAVVVRTRPQVDADGEPLLAFSVTDHGIGIDEATMGRLFNRFAQGDDSRARRYGGTGLGLEISRGLARLMHGDIAVQSQPGQGSCFTLTLPLEPVLEPPAPAPAAGPEPAGGRRLHLLVAEDHPVNRQYVAALLETMGHDAHFAANGREAVEAAATRAFDLVLMDLHMPEMDGVDATRAIRALPDGARSTVPIVAMTADAFAETRERCLVAGMNDFLAKPVSPQKLATLLRQLFGSGTGRPEGEPPGPGLSRATDGAPLIDDTAVAHALAAMSAERLAGLMASFLDQGPQTVVHLRAAVRDAQPLALRVNAHAAKGAALNLGLAALAQTAGALHDGATHLPALEIARLVSQFEDQLQRTRQAAQARGLLPV